jgi:2-aminoadipate transaminase
MRHAIDLGLQQSMVDKLRATYRRRVEAMEIALAENIGGRARWKRPDGGYFFWLELESGSDTKELKKQALERGTGLQPGNVFSCENGFNNFIRLSFAHYRREQIREGVSRLAPLVVQGSRA